MSLREGIVHEAPQLLPDDARGHEEGFLPGVGDDHDPVGVGRMEDVVVAEALPRRWPEVGRTRSGGSGHGRAQ